MSDNLEKRKFLFSLILPFLFILLIWLIKIIESFDNLELYKFGVLPRSFFGLIGIFLSPFIHSDFNHLISNTPPLIFLGTAIIYFYRELAYKVIFQVWLIGGFFVWLIARDSYHIGASGLIYGIASFLFFSGIFRKDNRLTAISLLVVFLYGGLAWGIFPFNSGISWESHLISGICGFVLSQIYKREGPTKEILENDEDDLEDNSWQVLQENQEDSTQR